MSRSSRVLVAWSPALAYMALIWALSSLSHPPSVEDMPFRDKGAHCLEYAALAALLAHAFVGTFKGSRLMTLCICAFATAVTWGLLDEIHQAYVPNRVSDAQDLLADSIGALLGTLLYVAARKLFARSPKPAA